MCIDAPQTTRWVDTEDALLATRHHLPVLISGPSYTAVTDAARELHAASFGGAAPLVSFRASGFFEQRPHFATQWQALLDAARDGTLFVTAIEEMSCAAQLLLFESLTVDRPYRAPRLVSGTTVRMMDRLVTGEFSEELFYRLNIIHVAVRDERSGFASR